MERRVLIAIFLSFIVLYAYQAFFVKPVPKPAQQSAATQQAQSQAATGATPPAPATPATPAATPAAPAAAALVAESSERDVTVETHDVIAVLTNRGARLKSWRLKKYLDQQDRKPQELIENKLPN